MIYICDAHHTPYANRKKRANYSYLSIYNIQNLYGAPLLKTYAMMTWETTNQGAIPPVGVSYDKWIQCQDNFEHRSSAACADTTKVPGIYKTTNMWSPRRNLGAAHLHGVLYILGGKARTNADMGRDHEMGGVVGNFIQNDKFYSNAREPSVLLNDVWKSNDWGFTWTLVTAGCKAPQLDQILAGNPRQGKYGSLASQCQVDSDCYGNEICNTTMSTCVCQMWSPRQQHTVTTDDTYIYVMGGYTSPQKSHCGPYACGDPWANAYTGFMNVSTSTNRENHCPLSLIPFSPRHLLLFFLLLPTGNLAEHKRKGVASCNLTRSMGWKRWAPGCAFQQSIHSSRWTYWSDRLEHIGPIPQ